VEAIRTLMVAKRSARSERTQTINQARSLIVTGPDDLRTRFAAPRSPPWSASRRRCAPGPATLSAVPPASRCGS
jgi:transposase